MTAKKDYPDKMSPEQARTIRIPVHMIETINKLNRVSRQMLQENGREPTPEDLAKRMATMPWPCGRFAGWPLPVSVALC